jgi:putative spermidine/putrescine transport system permease protein
MAPALVVVVIGLIIPLAYFLRYMLAETGGTGEPLSGFTFGNVVELFTHDYYRETILRTFGIAAGSTILTLVLGLAVAKLIADARSKRLKTFLIIATVFPMLVGNVIRAIGWVALLGYSGVVNSMLVSLGLLDASIELLKTPVTVAIAITSVELPIMVMVLHASMELVGNDTTKAAQSLGAGPLRTFVGVTLPQIIPGLITGVSLVFVESVNSYATPLLVGGSQVPMIAPEIYSSITRANDWPLAAAMAAVTLLLSVIVLVAYARILGRSHARWSTGGTS